jgi:endonuclease/exonuclease/phosphatase family metal-dependent hydrolase
VANFVFCQSVIYTFHRSNAHSYIDHILVSENLLPSVMSCTIVDSGAVNPNPSDHFPLCLCLKAKLSKPDPSLRMSPPSSN